MPAAKKAAAKKTAARRADAAPDEQFPSETGDDNLEIAQRSADVHEERSSVHRKVFVVPPGTELTDEFHERNVWAMRQYLINQGMRPEEDGHYADHETNADGESIDVAYEISVQPAHVATETEVKNATVPTEGKTSTEDEG